MELESDSPYAGDQWLVTRAFLQSVDTAKEEEQRRRSSSLSTGIWDLALSNGSGPSAAKGDPRGAARDGAVEVLSKRDEEEREKRCAREKRLTSG